MFLLLYRVSHLLWPFAERSGDFEKVHLHRAMPSDKSEEGRPLVSRRNLGSAKELVPRCPEPELSCFPLVYADFDDYDASLCHTYSFSSLFKHQAGCAEFDEGVLGDGSPERRIRSSGPDC